MISINSTTLPKVLGQSTDSIFFEKPSRISIDENAVTKYSSSQKIETLIQELKEKGPLVALGHIGPKSYADAPFKLGDRFYNQDIYGWKPGAERYKHSNQSYVMLLGAKKIEGREHVYFTVSQDVTLDTKTNIRKHMPSTTDTKVYVTSHKTLQNYLCDLYPPATSSNNESVFFISSSPNNCPSLSPSEREYAEKLSSISPLDTILDQGKGEKQCKAIGQEVFEKYKKENNDNSSAGMDAAQRICDSIISIASDGKLRKQYIERAWKGIGDDKKRWCA